jgi:alkanesulfonate monooxygenase SsuD/methylene tetrahydromethanopterin reductase-like flavin-dependent oxidoreductase (luciferase family)
LLRLTPPIRAHVAKQCEALGFESFYLPEHPILPVKHKTRYPLSPDGEIPEPYAHMIDPFIGLTLAAAATKRIGLGHREFASCLSASPLVLAKVIATLDHYSGGRFIFGIGAGWLRDESEIMGVDFKRRWAITREYINAMKELWTKAEASFDGEFIKFPAVKKQSQARPQTASAGSHRSGRHRPQHGPRAARYGRNRRRLGAARSSARSNSWLELAKLKKLCAEAGRDFSKLEITIYAPVLQSGDVKRTIAAYEEAGAHRLILFPEKLAPDRVRA